MFNTLRTRLLLSHVLPLDEKQSQAVSAATLPQMSDTTDTR
jgi:hypothetical protein